MSDDFDRSEFGLHRCHLRVYHGLIFVCLCKDEPPDFDAQYDTFGEMLITFPAVPAAGGLGLALGAGVLALAGAIGIRRRK